MTDWTDAAEYVKASSRLETEERETTINFAKDQSSFRVFSSEKTVVKGILENEHADVHWVETETGDGYVQFDDPQELLDADFRRHTPIAVSATMPIGCLRIKGSPRKSDAHGNVARPG